MNTPITSDDLFLALSKKIENKKISEILNTQNIKSNLSDEHKNNKIDSIIENNFQLEKNLIDFLENQKFNFCIKSCQLEYNDENELEITNRLKLASLDFNEVAKTEKLSNTKFWRENKNIFFVWYKKNSNWKKSVILKSKLIELSKNKILMEILESDYQIIRHKIFIGKAHELAEGDTKFLGIVRDNKPIKKPHLEQPYSTRKTYARTIVLKNHFTQILYEEKMENNETIVKIEKNIKKTVLNYRNKLISQLMEEFQMNKLYPKIKEDIFFKILNVGSAIEFNKEENTNFNFFTITLNSKDEINNKVKINFNLIQQLKNPQNWESSETLKEIEKTSYVLIYKENDRDKLNPKIHDIKKMNFSDETIEILKVEYKKIKNELKGISSKTRVKEKFLYLDSEIIKKELNDF